MKKHSLIFFLIALLVFLLDQLTKLFIKTHVGPLDVIQITSFFNIVHFENTGSAFGLFRSLGNIFFVIAAVIAIILVAFLIIRDHRHRLSFALVLGGAGGNLADRIVFRHVTDFLDFHIGSHHWPAFNVADSALTIGIMLLLIRMALEKDNS